MELQKTNISTSFLLHLYFFPLAVKLETTHKPAKPSANQPQASQTIHKQQNSRQTTQKPANYEQKIHFLCYQKL